MFTGQSGQSVAGGLMKQAPGASANGARRSILQLASPDAGRRLPMRLSAPFAIAQLPGEVFLKRQEAE
ncbi:MAG TPA: hypothetical protein VIK11_13930 [Tepidiformaceae bacterium]